MGTINLHECENKVYHVDTRGLHDTEPGGWVTLSWGGMQVVLHYDDADVLRDVLASALADVCRNETDRGAGICCDQCATVDLAEAARETAD